MDDVAGFIKSNFYIKVLGIFFLLFIVYKKYELYYYLKYDCIYKVKIVILFEIRLYMKCMNNTMQYNNTCASVKFPQLKKTVMKEKLF